MLKPSLRKSTQALSLSKVNLTLGTRRAQVIAALGTASLSRAQITEKTGLRHSSVTARVKELLDLGVLRVAGRTFDRDTDRWVETVAVV